jgi:uncharacterized protein involved in response to NO
MLVTLKSRKNPTTLPPGPAVLYMGFRIFFLGASLFSALSILYWMLIYVFGLQIPLVRISVMQWHSHEMIYGYSLAVIAGFILTAETNWTGRETISGKPLMFLFALWAFARLLFALGSPFLIYAGVFDILFSVFLVAAICEPIIKTRQWKQIAIVSKVVVLGIGNLVFYLGAMGVLSEGVTWGIYGGLYLVIGLILTMARRTVPFFIERGVDYEVSLYNSRWLDLSSLFLFLAFFVSELFLQNVIIAEYLAFALFVVHSIRLLNWHSIGIWNKSLLWSLYLPLWFICLGFLLFSIKGYLGISKFSHIHAFAYGGIGLITISMMTRVSLGHSGRNIAKVSRRMILAFMLLTTGAVLRVVFPLFINSNYVFWVFLSQIFWFIAFSLFFLEFLPILTKPRLDGERG